MAKKKPTPPEWAERFKAHLRTHEIKREDLITRMKELDPEIKVSEPTLRSWLNGHRKINMAEFNVLCDAAGADRGMIYLGRPALTDAQWTGLRAVLGTGALPTPTLAPPPPLPVTQRPHKRARR